MSNTQRAIWALRIGVAGEFLGHAVFALQGKPDWIKWFSNFGVSDPSTAATLLTLVGILDLLVALTILFKPIKPVLLWAVFWGFWTALVRPIVGMPIWDFIERFANWAAPLALFYLIKNEKGQ
ncbi:MAG: hypothetical protein A2741_01920 [Candidatus Zambryskibacteria bacterium RIFCSPHIGHO2_01_FULL_43_27]|uniref:DoxX family protein n=1 Tax=Candidatus Zambryskibacteria bacterium RIFCSPLOWO2_01_FULL_43_17 TaxID=1802760 RepID=A0A1G2U100_9BACT|nr:MAG: hypothetical protein A2741_01920 [Candidatus Zambryskibacteria bacterium RIFCSPHIGHO2_01_FULL_43_27]OHA99797.1 MAG: hypothetical protein A3E93_01015 [Candidatus Zambryskibacteria bacterium RIFCSPHIGHO2_12_FULL_43_12b]OHB03198.1 MAG: hypothetical protein A2920_02405 [Candidatus Zambryskibacteria bacterium RIFCSPLOWO2_01_FULL_43_17]